MWLDLPPATERAMLPWVDLRPSVAAVDIEMQVRSPFETTSLERARSGAPHASGFRNDPINETSTGWRLVFFTLNAIVNPGVPLVRASFGMIGANANPVIWTGRLSSMYRTVAKGNLPSKSIASTGLTYPSEY